MCKIIWKRFLTIAVLLPCLICTSTSEMCQSSHEGYHNVILNGGYQQQIFRINYTCEVSDLPLTLGECGHNDCEIRVIIRSTKTKYFNYEIFNHDNPEHIKLFEIRMEDLHITELSPETFALLDFLRNIFLSENDLTIIEENTFSFLPSLEYLDLSMNALKNISRYSFTGSTNLKYLNLSHNFLTSFDISSMSVAKHLTLDLSFNNVTDFDFEHTVGKMELLNLSHNSLTEIKDCFPTFKIINLSNNKLKAITNVSCFTKYDETVYLNLGHNFLSELKPDTLNKMSKLQKLFIEYNNLTLLPNEVFSRLDSLKLLNISHNHLKEFQHGLFEHMEHLEVLDTSYNDLGDIGEYIHSLSNLTDLRIDNNQIDRLDIRQLLSDLPYLRNLSIHQNMLTCKELIEIFRKTKKRAVTVPYGEAKTSKNVHGIKCDDDDKNSTNTQENGSDILKKVEQTVLKKLSQYEGSFGTNNKSLTEFFNNGFKNSDLYNYLVNMTSASKYTFNESEFVSYFDRDFKNSSFFKYLEQLKEHEIASADLNKSFYKFFNDDFKNSTFVKYFENLTKTDEIFNENFIKSKMFNFFNSDFQNSNFYRYMESLKAQNGDNIKQNLGNDLMNFEKLIRTPNLDGSDAHGTIVIVFLAILILMVGFLVLLATKVYVAFLKGDAVRQEQVELIST